MVTNIDEIAFTRSRLRKAEAVADSLRYDDRLHELALAAVFAIEDRLFALEEAADSAALARPRAPRSAVPTATIIPFPQQGNGSRLVA